LVVDFEVVVDGFDEFGAGFESSPSDGFVGDFREESLDEVEPGTRGGHEVHVEPEVSGEPFFDLGMLVGPVVVENKVKVQVFRGLAVDLDEKLDELLMPMTFPSRMLSAANRVVVPWRL